MKNKIKAVLFFAFILCIKSNAQSFNWSNYTVDNKLWNYSDTGNYLIILKNNKTCLNCYRELNEYLQNISGYSIYCLVITDSSVLARKLAYKQIKELMPDVTNILFDYEHIDDIGYSESLKKNSVFYLCKVDFTPAIVKVNKGRITYLPYNEIFSTSNGSVINFLKK